MIQNTNAERHRLSSKLLPVFALIGRMLILLSVAMLVPAFADIIDQNLDWKAFALASIITFIGGAGCMYVAKGSLIGGLTLRQAFILTPLAWTTVAAFGALPLYISDYAQLQDHYINAFFESISGLTTTGSTIIVGLDSAPPGVLLWRAILQWIGGIGIIATAIAILPALGVGGMQLFRTESSDRSDKVMPRVRQMAAAVVSVYIGLTLICGISYFIAGMTPFEALVHALTTISTGGYSTSDNSMGNWGPGVQWVASIFMLSGAIPFILYVQLLRGDRNALRNSQVRVFLGFLSFTILIITFWLVGSEQYEHVGDALRFATFNVISVVTTTGYATTDYSLWGNIAVGIFFGLMFIGGCTGSTAGGIKIYRFEVMAILLRSHFLSLLYPRALPAKTYNNRVIPETVINSVVVFFSLYFICYAALTIAVMGFDLDFLTSASAVATSLSNVGPGLGSIIGPAGNFSTIPDGAKLILCFAMLLGRLELFTVLMLFYPRFWRQ